MVREGLEHDDGEDSDLDGWGSTLGWCGMTNWQRFLPLATVPDGGFAVGTVMGLLELGDGGGDNRGVRV